MSETNLRPIQWRKSSETLSHSATEKINNSSTTSQEERALNLAGFSLDEFGVGQEFPEKLRRPVDDVFDQIIKEVENRTNNETFEVTPEIEMEAMGVQSGIYTEDDLEAAKSEAYLQGVIDGESKEKEQLINERERLSALLSNLQDLVKEPKLAMDSEFETLAVNFLKNAASALVEGLYDQLSMDILEAHINSVVSKVSTSNSKVEVLLSSADFELIVASCPEPFENLDFKACETLSKGDVRIVTRGDDLSVIQESELRILGSIKEQIDEA